MSVLAQSNDITKPKFKIMEGQTDEERRELRKSFRQVQSTIESKTMELEDANSSALDEIRGDNNALFAEVRFPRESVLDSVNVQGLATRAARQVDRLVEVISLDDEIVARSLLSLTLLLLKQFHLTFTNLFLFSLHLSLSLSLY